MVVYLKGIFKKEEWSDFVIDVGIFLKLDPKNGIEILEDAIHWYKEKIKSTAPNAPSQLGLKMRLMWLLQILHSKRYTTAMRGKDEN